MPSCGCFLARQDGQKSQSRPQNSITVGERRTLITGSPKESLDQERIVTKKNQPKPIFHLQSEGEPRSREDCDEILGFLETSWCTSEGEPRSREDCDAISMKRSLSPLRESEGEPRSREDCDGRLGMLMSLDIRVRRRASIKRGL